jgi:hypothetical protein
MKSSWGIIERDERVGFVIINIHNDVIALTLFRFR